MQCGLGIYIAYSPHVSVSGKREKRTNRHDMVEIDEALKKSAMGLRIYISLLTSRKRSRKRMAGKGQKFIFSSRTSYVLELLLREAVAQLSPNE